MEGEELLVVDISCIKCDNPDMKCHCSQCLRFGLWLTMSTIKGLIHILTYTY